MLRSKALLLFPMYGIALFFCLYIVAAWLYPGGTKFDRSTVGFSMRHNYWCDLLDRTAYNGQPNTGSSIAIAATLLLCLAVGWLCYVFPLKMRLSPTLCYTIQFFGVLSMAIFALLFTPLHNWSIEVGAPLAGVAMAAMLAALYRLGWTGLLWFAVVCFLLAMVNYAVYQSKIGLGILPVLQKIMFALFAIWFALVTAEMARSNTP